MQLQIVALMFWKAVEVVVEGWNFVLQKIEMLVFGFGFASVLEE